MEKIIQRIRSHRYMPL